MPLYDDLLVDGDSLSELLDTGICIEGPWEWPYLSADQRGDLPVYLGYDGVGYADQPYNPYLLPLYITLDAPACEGADERADRAQERRAQEEAGYGRDHLRDPGRPADFVLGHIRRARMDRLFHERGCDLGTRRRHARR